MYTNAKMALAFFHYQTIITIIKTAGKQPAVFPIFI